MGTPFLALAVASLMCWSAFAAYDSRISPTNNNAAIKVKTGSYYYEASVPNIKYAARISGAYALIQDPNASALREGDYATIRPTQNQDFEWVHFAIPSPVIFNGDRLALAAAVIRYRTGTGAHIANIMIHDGDNTLWQADKLNLTTAFANNVATVTLDKPWPMNWAAQISLGIKWDINAPEVWVSVISAGVDFVGVSTDTKSNNGNANPPNGPQGNSLFSLDPFLGTYDINISSSFVEEFNFTHIQRVIPLGVSMGGERQIFNKTADGSKYQEFVMRNESIYNSQFAFQLGVPFHLALPDLTIDGTLSMPNSNTLQGDYTFTTPGSVLAFVIQFRFNPDASGISVVIDESKPFGAQYLAFFNRCFNNPSAFSDPCLLKGH